MRWAVCLLRSSTGGYCSPRMKGYSSPRFGSGGLPQSQTPQDRTGWGTPARPGWGTPQARIGWDTPPPRGGGTAERVLIMRWAVCLLRSPRKTVFCDLNLNLNFQLDININSPRIVNLRFLNFVFRNQRFKKNGNVIRTLI